MLRYCPAAESDNTNNAVRATNNSRQYSKTCRNWKRGECWFGDDCWFSHRRNAPSNAANTAAVDESSESVVVQQVPSSVSGIQYPINNHSNTNEIPYDTIPSRDDREPKVNPPSQGNNNTGGNPLLRASWGQFLTSNSNGSYPNNNQSQQHQHQHQQQQQQPPQVNQQLYGGYDSSGWNTNRSPVVQMPQQHVYQQHTPVVHHVQSHPCPHFVHPSVQGVPPPPPPPPVQMQPLHPCPAHPSNVIQPPPQQQSIPPPGYVYHPVQPPPPPPPPPPPISQGQLPPMVAPHTPPQPTRMQLPPTHPHYHNPHRGIYSVRYYYGFVCYGRGSAPARNEDFRIPEGLFGEDGELTDDYETLLALDKNKVKVGVSDEQLREELRDVPYEYHAEELETEMCTICHDRYHEDTSCPISELPCSHRYHTSCIKTWLSCNTRCPICNWDSWKGGKHVVDSDTVSNWSNTTAGTTSTSRRRIVRDYSDISSWDDWFYSTVT